MGEYTPFVGREQELAQIDALVREWGTRHVLCLNAPAGIGKTRLLQELRQRYSLTTSARTALHITMPDIIDLADRTFFIRHNVGRAIARLLDERTFEPYLRVLFDW